MIQLFPYELVHIDANFVHAMCNALVDPVLPKVIPVVFGTEIHEYQFIDYNGEMIHNYYLIILN